MLELKGITWDHPRGYQPLVATAYEFQKQHPQVHIAWDVRSLKDFGDLSIESLAEKYDFVLMDHPFSGTGAKSGVLVPLDEWIPEPFLQEQARYSVGPSHRSYFWEGHQWALAVDAAAQVTACRADLLDDLDVEIPKSWDDVFGLAESLKGTGKIGMPLHPVDAVCCFQSLCANISSGLFWHSEYGIDPEIGAQALNLLQRLASLVDERSLFMNPIQMLDLMAGTNEIAYVPLIFGYTNYARKGYAKHLVRFGNIPSVSDEPSGALLGGVGLAISSSCKHIEAAVQYAMYVASSEVQRGIYFQHGGQPAHRTAWLDEKTNEATDHFFRNTLHTLELSFLRPRFPGYNKFQELAGETVHRFLISRGRVSDCITQLNGLYHTHVASQFWR